MVGPALKRLLGRVYEGLGEERQARATYEELASIWEQADTDLPDFIEMKAALSRLR